jgi:hypothetical protein
MWAGARAGTRDGNRDDVLSDEERAANDVMMLCVSRDWSSTYNGHWPRPHTDAGWRAISMAMSMIMSS